MRDWLSRLADPPAFRAFVRRVNTPDFRRALRLCLPAAIVAILLRMALLAFMPAAFVHNDTYTIVETASDLVTRGAFHIDAKKTFLVPVAYCLPALLRIPILPFAAAVQHLLGVLAVFLCGLLVFAWFRFWRWLIVPATLLLALDPVLLWYEHTALTEACAVFGVLLVALAATAFYRAPNRYTFALLLLATLFIAGARPEGRLFALFAVVLVARVLWGNWRPFRIAVAIALVWAAAIFALTRTGQSGLLLLTSVIHLAPQKLAASPDVAEKLADLSAQTRAAWAGSEPPKLVPLRKEISRRIQSLSGSKDRVDSVCKRAGIEIALRNLAALPGLALQKFIIAHRELPSGDFTGYAIAGQLDALYGSDSNQNLKYSHLLWGREFADEADARVYLQSICQPIPADALTRWLQAFVTASLAPIAPLPLPGSAAKGVPIPGLPWLYTSALLGIIGLAMRRCASNKGDRRPLNFHQLWGAFLITLWLLIMVTANIRARFRVLFEPFVILYALALLDTLIILLSRFRSRSE